MVKIFNADTKKMDEWPWEPELGKPYGNGTIAVDPPTYTSHQFEPDLINHPPHYTSHPSGVECIDVVRHMHYDVGTAVSYLWRHRQKGGRVDVEKAIWHLEDYLRNYPE